jgi:8-oxo-dGTP pyrophosphatase MutT (NUDIX family)
VQLKRKKYEKDMELSISTSNDNVKITLEEKERLINRNYEYLRNVLWLSNVSPSNYKNEDILAQKKFDIINYNYEKRFDLSIPPVKEEQNIFCKLERPMENILKNLILNSKTNFIDQEWEFPKGRKNENEKDIDCAFREFEEETGFSRENIKILNNVIPYEEIFIGSNYKSYKHRYFIGFMNDENHQLNNLNNYQKMEVSKIEWKTIDECLKSIRPNTIEKKNLIINVNKLLTTYRFYNNKYDLI